MGFVTICKRSKGFNRTNIKEEFSEIQLSDSKYESSLDIRIFERNKIKKYYNIEKNCIRMNIKKTRYNSSFTVKNGTEAFIEIKCQSMHKKVIDK